MSLLLESSKYEKKKEKKITFFSVALVKLFNAKRNGQISFCKELVDVRQKG